MKTFALILALLISFSFSFAQTTGSLSGHVYTDEKKESPLPGAQVYVETQSGKIGTVTDANGHFIIKPLNAGNYNLIVAFVGFEGIELENIDVVGDFDTDIGSLFLKAGINMDTCVIVRQRYKEPLINKNGGNIEIMNTKDINHHPDRGNLVSIVESMSSFYVSENREVFFRGSRSNMTAYIIDGVRVNSLEGVPRFAIGKMTVYAGGIPARYGDFTGGVVVVETLSHSDWMAIQRAKESLYRELNL